MGGSRPTVGGAPATSTGIAGKAWSSWPLRFESKQKVVEYWHSLLSQGNDEQPLPTLNSNSLNLYYNYKSSAGDQWYRVSFATPEDCGGINELAESLVDAHVDIFGKNSIKIDRDTQREEWC